MQYTIACQHFERLTPSMIYDILRLRSEVFVVEQQCIFLDADNKDKDCEHLTILMNGIIVGCTRLVPPGLIYNEMSIGRVATHHSVRGTGVGKLLMSESIKRLYARYGHTPIRIGAQYYLKRFYESFGFEQSGELYDEDGIDHIHMLRP